MVKVQKIFGNAFGRLARLTTDRRVLVFFFFVVISAIFWFLGALGREYTATVRYPVRYTNFPENMVMVGELPSDLELTVNAYGYTLLRYYVSRRLLPIVFDVNSFSLNRLPDTETRNFYILSSVAANRIAGQLGAEIEILDIRPDTLFFSFTDKISRKLPVAPVTELEFRPQFMLKGAIRTDPDSVIAAGPATIVDTMQTVPTLPLSIRGIDESVRKRAVLKGSDKIELSESYVWVDIPVDQFTEAGIRVPVEVINLPDTLLIKTFPSEVSVSYLVALTDYERVSRQQFRAEADYSIPVTMTGRLPVRLARQPDFIRAVRYYPQSVDFIVETDPSGIRTE